MNAIVVALLLVADDAAVRRAVATFNHTWERGAVVTQDARLPDFEACWAPSRSQMYFEVTSVRFDSPGGAIVEAVGIRYGSVMLRTTSPARFRLRREGADWKIDSLYSAGCPR